MVNKFYYLWDKCSMKSNINHISIIRDFLVRDHYHAVILVLVKQGMVHLQWLKTDNGFIDKNGWKKLKNWTLPLILILKV
jgi:hypothetical protein